MRTAATGNGGKRQREQGALRDFDAEFLVELPDQSRLRVLPRLDFPTREFPLTDVFPSQTSGDEYAPAIIQCPPNNEL